MASELRRSEAHAWADSGAMALTGDACGAPRWPGWPVASAMRTAAAELASVGGPIVDGPALLGERAASMALSRRGAVSAGGSCRLVRAADGWIAVNLARRDDAVLANAWLDDAGLDGTDPWTRMRAAVAGAAAAELVARAVPLGLAVSALDEAEAPGPEPLDAIKHASTGSNALVGVAMRKPPLVVDLSSLWAGPLCAHLIGRAGARVVKVESVERPDGARNGNARFFDLLHYGHETVALPFRSPHGRDALRGMLDAADVVIEASRPRALEQLGIDANDFVERGSVWVSITGYGQSAAGRDRVGFGDDVAIAAGLYAGSVDHPRFCGDAIADPIAGLWAAVGTLRALQRRSTGGCGQRIDISMVATARAARGSARRAERHARFVHGDWRIDDAPVAPPRARRGVGHAAPLGAHTDAVLREFGVRRWA